MGKGHYNGGSTVLGFGPTPVKAKGRTGGIGTSGAALREQRKAAAKKKKAQLDATIKANEKIVKKLGKKWAAEKGRTHHAALVADQRVKVSPLAAALKQAIPSADEAES